jgi:hypothetical protein
MLWTCVVYIGLMLIVEISCRVQYLYVEIFSKVCMSSTPILKKVFRRGSFRQFV